MRRAHGHDELDRNGMHSLMQPLEERVLAVGARFAPERGCRRATGRRAVAHDRLAVAFENELLEIRRQPRERVRVGNDDTLIHAGRLGVPEIDEREQRRQIARQRRIAEVRIHRGGAGAKVGEALPSAADRDRKSGRRPERETAADPVPHRQRVTAGDAESARGRNICGDGDEVRSQRGAAAELRGQPLARGSRVPERFLRRERLRDNHEQGRRRIGARQCA